MDTLVADIVGAERLQVLESLFRAFNAHDVAGVMACMTDDVVFETAVGPEAYGSRLVGREAVAAAFVAVWTSIPNVRWVVSRHGVDDDHGLTEWLFTGTKDGAAIRREGVDLFRFEGPLISSKRAFRKSSAA